MPDAWEIYYFGNTNAPNGGPGDDWDRDGVSNLAEFVAGTVPTNAASWAVLAVSLASNDVMVSFPALRAAGYGYEGKTRQYTLEVNTNLTSGSWQELSGWVNVVGGDSTKTCTNPATAATEFYRLRMELK